jgi:hypothetical protein
MSHDNIFRSMNEVKDNFFTSKHTNMFLKKKQKNELIMTINKQFPLESLIDRTVNVIPNTNSIYLDYCVFKMYANDENYQLVVDKIIDLILETIKNFGSFNLHINLDSFTVTSLERIQGVFTMYYDSCIKKGLFYDSKTIEKIKMYNSPSIISSIMMMLVKHTEPSIKNKIVTFSRHKYDSTDNMTTYLPFLNIK